MVSFSLGSLIIATHPEGAPSLEKLNRLAVNFGTFAFFFLSFALSGCALQLFNPEVAIPFSSATMVQISAEKNVPIDAYQFGSAVYLTDSMATFTVTNLSSVAKLEDLTLNGIEFPFSQKGGTCGPALATGSSCTYILNFRSPGAGAFVQSLALKYKTSTGEKSIQLLVSATGIAQPITVIANYPLNGANWNDYIGNDGTPNIYGLPNQLGATDTACAAPANSDFSACLHGGEFRKVAVPNANSCIGLSITDSLAAFNWVCQVVNGSVAFYSTGLTPGMGLGNLVTSNGWLANSVAIRQSGMVIMSSSLGVWWTNSVTPLPDNSASTATVVDLSSAGTIYTLASSASTQG